MSERPMLRIPRSATPTPTSTRLGNHRIPLPAYVGGAAVLVVTLLAASMQLGWFSTSGRVDSEGKAITLTASSAGADLKGWMTIAQVLDAYAIPKDVFYATFGIPSDVSTDATLGPLGEDVPGFELEQVRTWVDARNGTSTGDPTTTVPVAVTSTASARAVPATGEPSTVTAKPSVQATATAAPTAVSPAPTASAATTHSASDGTPQTVRGTTTLDELIALAHTTRATLTERFGIPASLPGSTTLSEIDDVVSVPDLRTWLASTS